MFAAPLKSSASPAIAASAVNVPAQASFKSWHIQGDKVSENKEQTFGPVLWTQYALHRGVLKVTAQFAPMEDALKTKAHFEIKQKGKWVKLQSQSIDPLSRTALCSVWRTGTIEKLCLTV